MLTHKRDKNMLMLNIICRFIEIINARTLCSGITNVAVLFSADKTNEPWVIVMVI